MKNVTASGSVWTDRGHCKTQSLFCRPIKTGLHECDFHLFSEIDLTLIWGRLAKKLIWECLVYSEVGGIEITVERVKPVINVFKLDLIVPTQF